jgi:hypothetical protein
MAVDPRHTRGQMPRRAEGCGGEVMKYIYVAGPYSGGDPVLNTRKAIEAGEFLIELGFVPFIPHLTHLWHLVSPHGIDYWYDYDNEWIHKCDGLLRLLGESKGADAEVDLALSLGLPVFHIIWKDGQPTLSRMKAIDG